MIIDIKCKQIYRTYIMKKYKISSTFKSKDEKDYKKSLEIKIDIKVSSNVIMS